MAEGVAFEYAITIAAVSPSSGSAGGGSLLTLSGGGFEHLGDSSAVTVGGQPCEVTLTTPSTLRCIVPAILKETAEVGAWVNSFYPAPPPRPLAAVIFSAAASPRRRRCVRTRALRSRAL